MTKNYRFAVLAVVIIFSCGGFAKDSDLPKTTSDLQKEAGGPISELVLQEVKDGKFEYLKQFSPTQLKCMRKQIKEYQEVVSLMGGEEAFKSPRMKPPMQFNLNVVDNTAKNSRPLKKLIKDDGGIAEYRGHTTVINVVGLNAILSVDPKTGEVRCDVHEASEIVEYLKTEYKINVPSSDKPKKSEATSSTGRP